jgi:glycosyltransferase involved in cell wall biosynthesis
VINYSIIIPHYNIPQLLVRCLKSIPERDDVQVIVVDDCSPDAKDYPTKYPELTRSNVEFHSTARHGGAGCARNVGLEHATGRWLVFADADDFFAENLDALFDQYQDDDADLIYFRAKCVLSEDVTKPGHRSEWLNKLWSDYEQNNDLDSFCGRSAIVWSKFFKRSLIERHHIRFDETRYSNDYWFAANAAVKAQKTRGEKATLYVVTERTGSLAFGMNTKEGELEERAAVCFRVQKLLIEHGKRTIPHEPFTMYMRLLFDADKRDLYYHYFRELGTIGLPRFFALRQMMSEHAGRLRKLHVYLLSYLHLIF